MAQEKLFENKIKQWLKDHNCYFVKFFANRMTKTGVPDILASVNGYFVGIEVKAQNGTPSELQYYNIRKIRESGGFAYIVYPTGWEDMKSILEKLLKDEFDRLDEREVLK
jgi:Holliday junction resolvase